MRLVKYAPFILPVIFSRNLPDLYPGFVLPDAPEQPTSGHLTYPILEAFKKFDTDGNELISIDELRRGMAAAQRRETRHISQLRYGTGTARVVSTKRGFLGTN
jgi:hypothetical protein